MAVLINYFSSYSMKIDNDYHYHSDDYSLYNCLEAQSSSNDLWRFSYFNLTLILMIFLLLKVIIPGVGLYPIYTVKHSVREIQLYRTIRQQLCNQRGEETLRPVW